MTQLSASLEDYLEAIWIAGREATVVRVKDLTGSMNVKTSSVIGALKNLSGKGLIIHERYGYIELTQMGETLARQIYERHLTLTRFLNKILGIDLGTSGEDACQIEHHVSRKTMDKIVKFIEFVETCPEGDPVWLSNFHNFAKKGSRRRTSKARQDKKEPEKKAGKS
ncbi:MAG: metal-dependent transcriptional regulator [Pseudomonadota bacterium]